MKRVNGLGYKNLVDYVVNRTTLKKEQFCFAMEGGDGYATFLVAMDNELVHLGRFSYDRFIRIAYPTDKSDHIAITRFLDLCIDKLENKKESIIPELYGNPNMWDEIYKKH